MKAYPEYKASGIEWLGEIPKHWQILPMKYTLSKSSAGVWGDEAKDDGNDIVCFRVADFDYPHLTLGYSKITYRSIPESQLSGREVEYGDIVIEKSGGGDLNPVGRAVISTFEGKATCSNFMHVISTNKKANNFYLNYLLATIYAKGQNWRYFAQTTGIQNLNVKSYLGQPIPLPPRAEQETIAAYLDDATGKIDALMAEKQSQVEELRSYRTSLITETVTRGLNPDAPLRPSGIDWLGNIPEHWTVAPFKRYYSTSTGITFTKADLAESGNPVISYGQIHSSNNTGTRVEESLIRFVPDIIVSGKQSALLSAGDFLFADTSEDFEGCGNCVYIDVDYPIYAGYHSIICKPFKLKEVFGKYLAYLYKTNVWRSQIRKQVYGVKVFSVTQTILNKTQILLPPLSEQREIAAFLDEKTAKIDELIGELEAELKDLADYKQAVITEAVTGKVDVRDWKPKD